MCTIPLHRDTTVGSRFYALPQSIVEKLHTSDYEPNTSRLACVLADKNNAIQWDTFVVSDFMRPSKDLPLSNSINYFYSFYY